MSIPYLFQTNEYLSFVELLSFTSFLLVNIGKRIRTGGVRVAYVTKVDVVCLRFE